MGRILRSVAQCFWVHAFPWSLATAILNKLSFFLSPYLQPWYSCWPWEMRNWKLRFWLPASFRSTPLLTVSLLGSHTFLFQWVLDALCFSEAPCLSGMRQNGEVENYGGVRRERNPSPGGEAGNPGWCCGGLKKNGPHRLIRSGTIRRCDLVGVDVA